MLGWGSEQGSSGDQGGDASISCEERGPKDFSEADPLRYRGIGPLEGREGMSFQLWQRGFGKQQTAEPCYKA